MSSRHTASAESGLLLRRAQKSGTTASVAMILIAAALSGCGKSASGLSPAMPAVPVLTAQAVRKTLPNQLHEIGTVEAFATVNIKSRIEGHLVAIHFKEGDFVTRDQLLFSLDARPADASVRQAEANLARDQAQAAQARTDEQRYLYLWQEKVGSRQQYDQSHASAATWTATVAADEAALETTRLDLQYTEIRSPIDGRTGDLQSHIGDLIKPDADTPLVTLTRIQPIYVSFSIPERELPAVREQMKDHPLEVDAAISSADTQESPEHGVLSFVDNTVDRTTGTILLKGLFQNENLRLWPGAFVNASLTLNAIRDAVVVPTDAIQTGQQGTFVFVVDAHQRVAMQPVATGAQVDHETVVERGLAAGQTVVTDGQLRLTPGAMVSVKQSL
jgi:membrane fusion protein, multidrug efflux system